MHLHADPLIYNLFQFFSSELRVCMSKSLFMSIGCLMGLLISVPHYLGCLLPGSLLLTRLACACQAPSPRAARTPHVQSLLTKFLYFPFPPPCLH